MKKGENTHSLSKSDQGLVRIIDQNYQFIESVMGVEPLIWFEFNVLPSSEEKISQIEVEVTLNRKRVFSNLTDRKIKNK